MSTPSAEPLPDHSPRVAVVTGGGSGIGAACAVALARAGWQVVTAGRRLDALESVAMREPGLGIATVAADVTDEPAVRRLFETTIERFDRLDLLFNNAGRSAPSVTIDELSLTDWRAVVDVNLTGMFLCAREAFRVMRSQQPQGGRIINNGSISAHSPRPMSAPYTATKHGVTGLTKSISLDGRPYGIACGQLDIGNATTEMTNGMAAGTMQADGRVTSEARMRVDDVAKALVYMADLPLEANVATMTVMATTMPFVGRG